MSRIDLIIFGASGFTGRYAIRELIKIYKARGSNFTWGIAGRNKEKLTATLSMIAEKENVEVSKIPIIIADINDTNSLNEMAKQARVIVNCSGPFKFYGEPVVRACVENKTHHVDVSGEPGYMEKMQVEYHAKAKENGVYIISACGFDSIPSDLGTVFLKNNFDGQVNSVEVFLESWSKEQKMKNNIHYGTWESAVYGIGAREELRVLRKKLFPKPVPPLTPKLKLRSLFSKTPDGKWCLPFPGSDKSVIKRTQYYFYEHEKERPIQVETYITFPNLLAAVTVAFMAIIFFIMSKFSLGRQLLLKNPKLFSLGFISHEGPSEEQADNTHFAVTIRGEGWKEKLADPSDKYVDLPNKKMVVKVSGRNPGYGATCILLLMSGLTILDESENMPDRGGVYTPGAAFAKTNIIKKLHDLGVKFEVSSKL